MGPPRIKKYAQRHTFAMTEASKGSRHTAGERAAGVDSGGPGGRPGSEAEAKAQHRKEIANSNVSTVAFIANGH